MLRVERHDATVVWTIDRPEAKNALDHATFAALGEAIDRARQDASVRACVLTGAGDTFVSGGDLREMRDKTSPQEAEDFSELGFHLCRALGELPVPVLCAMPGHAIGGGAELALACDMRVADERAVLAFKQVHMGVTTAWGTVPRLLALVSAGSAARLLYTGASLTAAEANAIGLVDRVAPSGTAKDVTLAWAHDVAKASPTAVARMKLLVREALLADGVRSLEKRLFVETWSGRDHAEAVEAYFERRAPRWHSR